MKITVLYGDDVERSRARFGKIVDGVKKRGWEINHIGKESSLREKMMAQTLIVVESVYVVEDYTRVQKADWEWVLENSNNEGNLLIWHRGAGIANLKKLLPKSARYEEFVVPKLIFKFCESVWPGNLTNAQKLLHELVERESVEFVVAMLARSLRDLWTMEVEPVALGYPEWRMGKLKLQQEKFEEGTIVEMIGLLAKADVEAKTGGVDLLTSLDLLLVKCIE